jgi:DNA-binding SARP family transcriptional activator
VDVWQLVAQGIAIGTPQSTIENLQSTIQLYRGPFLEGFSISNSAPFEEWLILTRERLDRQALRILYTLANFYEAYGEYELALGYARQQVELEPWLEEAHRQIMRLPTLAAGYGGGGPRGLDL